MKKPRSIESVHTKCPACGYASKYEIVRYGYGKDQESKIEKERCRRCNQSLLPKEK